MLCIGNGFSGPGIALGALGNYGELYILESDAYSGIIVVTPGVVDDLNEGVNSGITLDGAAGQFTLNTPGAYEVMMGMSFSLSGVTTASAGFYADGVLVPDTVKSVDIQNSNVVELLSALNQFELTEGDVPLVLEIRIWSANARSIDIEHLTFTLKGIG